jgi:mRNA-degrading endonuclease RelE of RelBE toxin-antitoxin system
MKIEYLNEFQRDLKVLVKKYPSLPSDLLIIEKILEIEPFAEAPFSFVIPNLGLSTCIIKIKKMACRSLKGRGVNSGFRLIYAHFEKEKRIVFIELYHKNNQGQENRKRIQKYFK